MKITKITLGAEDSMVVADFESVRPVVRLEAELEEGEPFEEAQAKLAAKVQEAYDRMLCLRISEAIIKSQARSNRPIFPWVHTLYAGLYKKIFG
jgi:hypothetical protein